MIGRGCKCRGLSKSNDISNKVFLFLTITKKNTYDLKELYYNVSHCKTKKHKIIKSKFVLNK